MRFISKYRAYSISAIKPVTPERAYLTGGKPRDMYIANFIWAGRGLSPWEIQAALDRFQFGGIAVGENPINRLSFFDTEIEQKRNGWDDETRELIEKNLMNAASYGIDFFAVEKPAAALPYATYPKHRKVQGRRTVEHAIEDIKTALQVTGIEAGVVIDYENDNSDQHSPAIIAALQQLPAESEAEEEVIAA